MNSALFGKQEVLLFWSQLSRARPRIITAELGRFSSLFKISYIVKMIFVRTPGLSGTILCIIASCVQRDPFICQFVVVVIDLGIHHSPLLGLAYRSQL